MGRKLDPKRTPSWARQLDATRGTPDDVRRIVVFHEKHGDRHFIVESLTALRRLCTKIVIEREVAGSYNYDDETTALFVNNPASDIAMHVIDTRHDVEYEGFEIIKPEAF